MAEIIAVANQKGGVGKTTTTHNISVGLAMRGFKVLMVDMDSQASLTICAGLEPEEVADKSIVSVLTDEKDHQRDVRDCIHEIQVGDIGEFPQQYYYIIPSVIDLADLEFKLFARVSRETILRRALEPIRDDYDYIVIDCPPQLSILTINALSCAEGVVIPCKCDYLSYRGLTHLKDTIEDIKQLINSSLQVYGVVVTFFEKRVKVHTSVTMQINEHYNLMCVMIKRVLAEQGIFKSMAVVEYKPESDIAKGYMEMVDMIITKDYKLRGGLPSA